MDELNITSAVILFVVGAIASFIGTNTGGTALVTTAALVMLGMPVQFSIATAKVGTIGTMFFGWLRFQRSHNVNYHIGFFAALCAGMGAVLGAMGLVHLSLPNLDRILGVGMLILLLLMWLYRSGLHTRIPNNRWTILVSYGLFFFIGLWGGFLPGQGILSTYILLFCFGQSMLNAAGTHKIIGLSINTISLIVYIVADLVAWLPGLILLVSSSIGSYYGAAYAIKKGNKYIRWLFIVVVALLAIKLLLNGGVS